MSLHFKCPLCLKTLNSEQKLQRFCTIHDRVGDKEYIFTCDRTNLSREPFCYKCNEASEETIDEGVFLRHTDCAAENPFWKDGTPADPNKTTVASSLNPKVEIPGEENSRTVKFQLDFGMGEERAIDVRHWLLGTLRRLPKTEREMWFPLMMLRATAEKRRFGRIGKLIELVGPQGSGKTILAILAANQQGWNLDGKAADVHLNNYIFSKIDKTGGLASLNRYIETLLFWQLLHDNNKDGLFVPQGTTGEGHLKVCFIKPSEIVAKPRFEGLPSWEQIKHFAGFYRKGFGEWIKNLLTFSSNNYPFWYSAIFYDSSGEDIQKGKSTAELSGVDLVVIVVNAVDLFLERKEESSKPNSKDESSSEAVNKFDSLLPGSGAEKSSLRIAWQRIQQGFERKKQCFLVVTQLDRVKEQIGTEDWKQVEYIANKFEADQNFSQTKTLIKKWLEQHTTDDNAEDLAKNLHRFDKAFFVWTENLPKQLTPTRQTKMPASHGIAKFMCACLNVEWKAVCQIKNKDSTTVKS